MACNSCGHGKAAHAMVAVGTRIAPRPPPRSRRALLTHRAPPSGSGVEAVQGLRVQYPNRREEAVGHAGELLPVKECPLAAPFEGLEPAPADLGNEPPQARVIARDGVVLEMPCEHLFHPRAGLGDGVVH